MKRLQVSLIALLFSMIAWVIHPTMAYAQGYSCSAGEFVINPTNKHSYCVTVPGTWTDAQAEAAVQGGNLVTIDDQTEQDWLLQTFGTKQIYWIGYTDQSQEGAFAWISGQRPSYTNWLATEPNDGKCYKNEDYAAMNWFSSNGSWNDLPNDGFWQDCSGTFTFCGIEPFTVEVAPTCLVGFQVIPGIVEVEKPAVVTPAFGSITGLKWNDLNGNGSRDSELIKGSAPNVIFVIDVSSSTDENFLGTPIGDVNFDQRSNRILDAEIAGFVALNQQLIDQGLGDTSKVGVVVFAGGALPVDMDPTQPGQQLLITPAKDNNNNGVSDVKDLLTSTKYFVRSGVPFPFEINRVALNPGTGQGTNYKAALQTALSVIRDTKGQRDETNVIFMSDGEPYPPRQQFTEEAAALKAASNLAAFGIGKGAKLPPLQILDPKARIFTTTDELLTLFGGVKGGSSTSSSGSTLEPPLGGVTIYLDRNNNGLLDSGEPSQVTGKDGRYQFADVPAGTYTVREVLPSGYTQTFPKEVHSVTVTPAQASGDFNFGNIKN